MAAINTCHQQAESEMKKLSEDWDIVVCGARFRGKLDVDIEGRQSGALSIVALDSDFLTVLLPY